MNCIECNRFFTPTMGLNTICSVDCKLNRKNRNRRLPKINNDCMWCNKQFLASDHRRKFCSRFCKRRYDSKNRELLVARRVAMRISFKRLLPSNCEICGFSRAIQYAHIKGVVEGGETTVDNILVLCPNHHWLFDHNMLTFNEFIRLIEAYNPSYIESFIGEEINEFAAMGAAGKKKK